MPLPDPVIVVPGITAVYLRDDYPLHPEDIWTVVNRGYGRAALHPDDPRYEAQLPAVVRAGQLYEVAYKELIEELRHNLSPAADQPVPVYPFAYDWRQPLETTEAQLKAFVEEIVDRTALLPHYARDGYRARGTVALVGHSMGGLVIAGYIERYKRQSGVSKIVTLATPFRGSFEAVIKLTTGTADLGAEAPSSREREAARITPALYYLLPKVDQGLVTDPGVPASIFDPGAWQPSVVQTIQEYIRIHGVNPTNPAAPADTLFRRFLGAAAAHCNRISGLALDQAGLRAQDWLCVVGVGTRTRVRLQIVRLPNGAIDFRFHSDDRDDQWGSTNPNQRIYTGDGTVPFEGAIPSFLSLDNLVCVTPEDYGYWEVEDRLTTQVAGFHGILPNMDMLHRLIVRHFTGAGDTHENTWGRRAPGVANWRPAVMPLTEK